MLNSTEVEWGVSGVSEESNLKFASIAVVPPSLLRSLGTNDEWKASPDAAIRINAIRWQNTHQGLLFLCKLKKKVNYVYIGRGNCWYGTKNLTAVSTLSSFLYALARGTAVQRLQAQGETTLSRTDVGWKQTEAGEKKSVDRESRRKREILLERNNLEKERFKKVDGPDIENPSRIFKYLLLPIQSSDKFRGTLSVCSFILLQFASYFLPALQWFIKDG